MSSSQPAAPDDASPAKAATTFLDCCAGNSGEGADVAVLGLTEAADGATAVRGASRTLGPWNSNLYVDVAKRLRIVDLGDVARGADSLGLTSRLEAVSAAGAVPLCLGGGVDTLRFTLAAATAVHGPVALVRFDAHSARRDGPGGEPEPLSSVRTLWAGVRGSLNHADEAQTPTAGNLIVLTYEELAALELPELSERIHALVGGAPCVVSFDLDFVDAAYAPGAVTPAVGGPSSREALTFLRAIAGLRFCAFECVGLEPRLDPSGITALLAASVCFELLALLALQR